MGVHVGTSGWQYRHWREAFYPAGLPADEELAFYASQFACVEVNNTFYRLPEKAVFERWRGGTPGDFTFAVKVSRYLTHIKRLKEPREPVERLLSRAGGLGPKLGPVLLQMPPTMSCDLQRLDETLAAIGSVKVAVEFREQSWFGAETRRLLERHGAALCLADRGAKLVTPAWRTADWGYIRFHGGDGAPPSCYHRKTLENRAALLAELWPKTAETWAFFNNDAFACAPRDAVTFAECARGAGLKPTRTGAAAGVSAGPS